MEEFIRLDHDQTMAKITTSKTFLSQREPPLYSHQQKGIATLELKQEFKPIQTQSVTNLILPTKTYARGHCKKTSTPTNLSFVSCNPTKPNEAIGSRTPLIFNLKAQSSTVPRLVKIIKGPIKPVKMLNSGSKVAIDLPSKFSNPVSTILTLPLPELDSSKNTCINLRKILPKAIKTEVTPEPLDDAIDPLNQESDEAFSHEPVGELLKIVTNLPPGDQVIFIKLLVLQLNEDMLGLVRKLVNSLQKEQILEEDLGNVVDVKEEMIDQVDVDLLTPKVDLFEKNDCTETDHTYQTSIRMFDKKLGEPKKVKEVLKNMDTFKDVEEPLSEKALKISKAMKNEMIDLVKSDPMPRSVHTKRESVVKKYSLKYQKSFINAKLNSQLWYDIVLSLGSNPTLDAMLNSVRIDLVGDVFPCSKCDQIYDSSEQVRKHIASFHNGRFDSPVVCDQCPKTFISKSGWKNHMDLHKEEKTEEKNIQCEDCPKRFHSESVYNRHKTFSHMPAVCEQCGKTFADISSLNKHELYQHSDPTKARPFLCDECPSAFYRQHDLNAHKNIHLKPYSCNNCDKSFSRKVSLREHQACHGIERNFKCKHCSRTFKFDSSLNKHVRVSHSSDLPHECDVCHKKFPILQLLKVHKMSHLDESEWPFSCDKCGKRFQIKQNMQVHIKKFHEFSHLNESEWPFGCDKCGKRFKIKQNMEVHIKKNCPPTRTSRGPRRKGIKAVIGTDKVECNICGKPLMSKNLLNHLSTHSTEKPYSCEEPKCKKSFGTKDLLSQHGKYHSKPHSCDQCTKSFGYKRDLKQHKEKNHSKIEETEVSEEIILDTA